MEQFYIIIIILLTIDIAKVLYIQSLMQKYREDRKRFAEYLGKLDKENDRLKRVLKDHKWKIDNHNH